MTIKKRPFFQILWISMIGIFAFGCSDNATPTPSFTPSSEQMDKSPFTGIPCAAPCWHGLEVGKSTEKDSIAIIPTLSFIDQSSVQIFRRPSMPDYYNNKPYGPGTEIVADCINYKKRCLDLITANDVLQRIIVKLNFEMSADKAIEYLGIPDYIGYDDFSSERIMCEVYLVWSKGRLVLATTFEDLAGAQKYCYVVRSEGKVPANLPILEVRYLTDKELKAYFSSVTGKSFEFSGTIPEK